MGKKLLFGFLIYSTLIHFSFCLYSEDQCYNVTCDTLTSPECVKTSENDKTITLNVVYCNNSKIILFIVYVLDKL